MCYGCYLDAGAPKMRSPAVRRAAALIEANPSWSWGGLHIVFEDENLDADSLDYCLAHTEGDLALSAEERAFAKMLKGMTHKARVSAFGLARGYFR